MVIDVNLPPDYPDQNFEDFFRDFEDEPSSYKYREKIQQAAITNENTLSIWFEDVLLFDPALAEFLKNEPEVALDYAVEAFKELLRTYSGGQIDDIDYFVRITTRNQSNEVPLRDLRSIHIDKLVYVYGILIRASQVIPQITIATFQCPVCQTEMEVEQVESGSLIKPRKCANPSCNNKSGFIVVSKNSEFIDWQSIRIQELPEELKPGRVPYAVKSILTHDLVDRARPGDRVKITGVYKIIPSENRRGKTTTLFTPYIKILSIEGRNLEDEELDMTPEELAEIRTWAKKPDIQKIVAKSLAPGIMGNNHLKMAAAMALFGGVRKEFEGKSTLRGDIHVLFVGDPGTGKSQILKQCAIVSPQAIYTSGRGSSAAGLTAGIVKESDGGSMSLEAGALVLADGGNAMIDEFDKMNKKDRVAIHEAMEQQTVSIAKAGIIATLRAQTSIIAAANPKYGRYDINKTPTENINLSPPIISRFDLIFIVRDIPDEDTDEKLAEFILKQHARDIAEKEPEEKDTDMMRIEFLKKYIHYARNNIHPKLTPEAIDEIKKFYVDLRAENKNKEDEGGQIAVPIVARNLEGFIRISEAYAKMELSNFVTREHAKKALKIARRSIEDTSRDSITGELSADILFSGITPAKRRIFNLLDILKKRIEENDGKSIDEETFIGDLELDMNMKRDKIISMLDQLYTDGFIFKPRPGLIALSHKQKK